VTLGTIDFYLRTQTLCNSWQLGRWISVCDAPTYGPSAPDLAMTNPGQSKPQKWHAFGHFFFNSPLPNACTDAKVLSLSAYLLQLFDNHNVD
jgi:hypothetical protein